MANISENIELFLSKDSIQNKENGRYRSWNIVFEDFTDVDSKGVDYLARSLSLYLASWGMMRGSSKLLTDYNYLVHIPAVEILLKDLPELRKYPAKESHIDDYVELVWGTLEKLWNYYSSVGVTPTETLRSKIILGVSASTPAYDKYFKKFLKHHNLTQKLSKDSLRQVWEFWFKFRKEVSFVDYPPMKLIDMAGFQFGKQAN